MKKIALLLIATVAASAHLSAGFGSFVSGAFDKASSAVSHATSAYNKFNEWKDTELGQQVSAYAKEYGPKAAEKAYGLAKGYLSN